MRLIATQDQIRALEELIQEALISPANLADESLINFTAGIGIDEVAVHCTCISSLLTRLELMKYIFLIF